MRVCGFGLWGLGPADAVRRTRSRSSGQTQSFNSVEELTKLATRGGTYKGGFRCSFGKLGPTVDAQNPA